MYLETVKIDDPICSNNIKPKEVLQKQNKKRLIFNNNYHVP